MLLFQSIKKSIAIHKLLLPTPTLVQAVHAKTYGTHVNHLSPFIPKELQQQLLKNNHASSRRLVFVSPITKAKDIELTEDEGLDDEPKKKKRSTKTNDEKVKKERPSPNESSRLFDEGHTLIGGSGEMYEVKVRFH